MANYRKSFNLRNGVQVDDDNFIVNANGLVGIGTSVPTEFLDVRGNVKVVGLVTASRVSTPNLQVTGVGTFATLTDGTVIISSGIVTASSGIVTYYGDGQGLTNIPTSQWVDVNTGTGYSSIYAAGTVGIATTMPNYFLQVGGNPDTISGVGINSTGDIKATGIITASSFVGSGIGITQINASNIESGILSNSRLPSNINISGVITATSGFVGNLTGIASTAHSITNTANIIVNSINSGFSTTGISTVFTSAYVGTSGTAFAALNSGRIGIGTALPTSEIQIRKESNPLLEVLSNTDQARISIGQSVGVGKSTAVLRFGNESKTFDIINNDTGNINLYLHAGPSGVGTGRFSWLYGQSNAELASLTYDGNFGIGITNPTSNLHVVGTSTVTGNANFGSNVTINGTLSATSLNLSSISANLVGNVYAASGISTFNIVETAGNIIVSSASSIGIGTTQPISGLDAREKNALFSGIGINTNVPSGGLTVIGGGNFSSSVGIGTTFTSAYLGVYGSIDVYPAVQATAVSVNLYKATVTLDSQSGVGIGTTLSRSVADFADAGKGIPGQAFSYMIPPRLTTAQRVGLSTVAGAFIFNTDVSKFQGYTGVGWTDFH